jgi:hypothetical protein
MIACAAPLARHADLIAARRRRVDPGEGARPGDRSSVNSWLVASIAIAAAVAGGMFSPRLSVGPDYPVGAIAFMRARNLHGNLLSNFARGEYLIWHLPDSKVFVDGRYDTVYPAKVFDDYLAFINGQPGALSVLRSYPHDLVLVPHESDALKVMADAPEWKIIYRDQNWILFARTDSAAAGNPGVPVEGPPPAASFFP